MRELGGAVGAVIVLIAAILYACVALAVAWLFGGSARLGGPDDPRR